MERSASTTRMRTIDVLATPLALTSYDQLAATCHTLASAGGTHAIDFTNTQIVTLRRHDPQFRKLTEHFDHFVPDGMPLVWVLNRRGANLRDRVYGPTFMRKFLERDERAHSHYLIGGSSAVGERLRARFPQANFVGSFHGRCDENGVLEGGAEEQVIEEINRLSPDFIWVGLGTPKQYAWIHRHKALVRRGVLLAVGFAFDVNAGMKPDAPGWMQRAGLTWLFRLGSEPRRLALRYLRYNTLFLAYLSKDRAR
jgi:N-acetylglucosaminyldiphosphoundecaprenol N-acetyl-beta-D-mannosaminyltransferase